MSHWKFLKEISAKIYSEKKYFPELEEDVKWLADNFALCEKFMDMLVRYMQLYKTVNAYFTNGEKISEETKASLASLKKEADKFLAEINGMDLEAIDYLGGFILQLRNYAEKYCGR